MTDIDPIDAAVIRSGLVSAAREMFSMFHRTAMLPVLYDAKDFSISVFDDRQNLVADAPGLPDFVGSLSCALSGILEPFDAGRTLVPGDVLIANDPFLTGAHPADVALVAPGFADGVLAGFCAMRAHVGDLGGANSYPADAESVYDEGLRLTPLRLVRAGEPADEIFATIAANSRLPRETIGNLRSAAGVLSRGAEKIERFAGRYGMETYHAALDQLLDAAEHQAREVIAAIPDGEYSTKEQLELDPELPAAELHCTVRINGSELEVDTTGSCGPQPGALNVPLVQTLATCRLAIKRLTTQDSLTANSGEYRMLRVTVEPGSIFDAQSPQATYMMGTTASLLSEAVVTALSTAGFARAMAQSGGHTTGFIAWCDDGPGGRPALIGDLAPIGYGAIAEDDGLDAAMHFCLSGMGLASGEVVETRSYLTKQCLELLPDTGGPGRRRGGLGSRTDWRFETAAVMTSQAQKVREVGGAGLVGGEPAGGRNDTVLAGAGLPEQAFGIAGSIEVAPGQTVTMYGAGGGGFGDPREREPAAVLDDVLDGLVSIDAARDAYGVVLTQKGRAVDEAATEALREDLREKEKRDDGVE